MDDALLRPTFVLDYEHPAVAAFVRRTVEGAGGELDHAARLFRAVRDGIRYDPYSLDPSPAAFTASATLARGAAFCIPKAILLAASLRSVGIPAQLGFCDVTNHLVTPRLRAIMRTDVFAFHGYVVAHLGGRRVKATPAFDAALCARFGVPPLELDGEHDAVLQAFDGEGREFMTYLDDRGVFDDFPHAEFLRVWRETYPHLASGMAPGGDFAAEAGRKA